MEWYWILLMSLGVWVFGFFTGTQAGATAVIVRLHKPPTPNPQQPNPQDMAALMQMMGRGAPGQP